MTLKNEQQLANTQKKLAALEKLIDGARANRGAGQATELRSLTRMANQLREEISRYLSGASKQVRG